jgi:hypothetical protein
MKSSPSATLCAFQAIYSRNNYIRLKLRGSWIMVKGISCIAYRYRVVICSNIG